MLLVGVGQGRSSSGPADGFENDGWRGEATQIAGGSGGENERDDGAERQAWKSRVTNAETMRARRWLE
jgi:hypothetical protein